MRVNYLVILAASGLSASLFAQQVEPVGAESVKSPLCQEAMTVFQDVSGLGRKDRAAKNITQKHQEMAREGWHFVDMEVYTENGDLEGFYLSYVRNISCQEQTRDYVTRLTG